MRGDIITFIVLAAGGVWAYRTLSKRAGGRPKATSTKVQYAVQSTGPLVENTTTASVGVQTDSTGQTRAVERLIQFI